jgi:hypothetical protein
MSYLLGGRQQGGLSLNPVTQSILAQQLLAGSMQSPQGLVSPSGVLAKALQGLTVARDARAQGQLADQTSARQQGLAGALSRTNSGDPAKAEAARRAAMIIAGGIPNDPTAQQLLQGQAKAQFGSQDSLFGVVDPGQFTPDSLQKFAQTKQYGDLVRIQNQFGRINFSDYTPESIAKYKQTNNEADLVLQPNYRFQQTPSGAVVAGNTVTGQTSPTAVTPQAAIDEAGQRKRAESEAAAQGQAVGTAQGAILTRALNAGGIEDILDMAPALIDEATGSGVGASRDKLAAFFGVSTTGAQAIAQLLPLQAAIMLRQPRMEGPQSDRDVQLYRDAAGQIGDPAVPRETKLAALKTITRLQQVYKNDPAGGGGQQADEYKEGDVVVNQSTGERLMLRNNEWVKQ